MATTISVYCGGSIMQGSDVALAAIGVVITSVGALIWIVKYLMIEMKKSIDHNTQSYIGVSKILTKLEKATSSADEYLRQRNGRDNEQHNENIKIQKGMVKQMEKIPDIIYSKEKQRAVESKAILEATQQIPITLKKIADAQAEAIIKAVVPQDQYIAHQQVAEVHIVKQKVDKSE